jgi:hypothetical protein
MTTATQTVGEIALEQPMAIPVFEHGLYDANRSRVPVVAIAAHIPSREIGSGISRKPIRNSSSRSAATTAN